MKPVSPVVKGYQHLEVTLGKYQPQYIPLPCLRSEDGMVITCWQLSWKERLRVLLSGSVWLSIMTFNNPVQPVKIQTTNPLQTGKIE